MLCALIEEGGMDLQVQLLASRLLDRVVESFKSEVGRGIMLCALCRLTASIAIQDRKKLTWRSSKAFKEEISNLIHDAIQKYAHELPGVALFGLIALSALFENAKICFEAAEYVMELYPDDKNLQLASWNCLLNSGSFIYRILLMNKKLGHENIQRRYPNSDNITAFSTTNVDISAMDKSTLATRGENTDPDTARTATLTNDPMLHDGHTSPFSNLLGSATQPVQQDDLLEHGEQNANQSDAYSDVPASPTAAAVERGGHAGSGKVDNRSIFGSNSASGCSTAGKNSPMQSQQGVHASGSSNSANSSIRAENTSQKPEEYEVVDLDEEQKDALHYSRIVQIAQTVLKWLQKDDPFYIEEEVEACRLKCMQLEQDGDMPAVIREMQTLEQVFVS